MSAITDLPTNVLCLFIDNLPFSSHFDFACTCKTFAAASQPVLRRHQKAYNEFRIVSDKDPSTVLLLLQSIFGTDQIPAWHVRSFEIWRDRTNWDEWEIYSLYAPLMAGLEGGVSDMDILSFQPLLARVGEYLDKFQAYLHGDVKKGKVLTQIESGHDGPLKALLLAALPRLKDLKLVTRSQATGSTLSWLKVFIATSGAVCSEPDSSVQCGSEDRYTRDETAEESEEVALTRKHYERLLQSANDADRMELSRGTEEADDVTEAQECHEELRQRQLDGCVSPTESEFNRDWEAAYLNWMEEQALQELETMKIDKQENPGVSQQEVTTACEDDSQTRHFNGSENQSNFDNFSDSGPDSGMWPPGFASLRSVAVGVVSGTWMDDDQYPKSAALVARLLRLPAIECLYLNGLRSEVDDGSGDDYENDDDSDAGSDWERDEWMMYNFSSSVQHFFFEGLGYELDGDFRTWLCSVPRKLLTAAFRNSDAEGGDVQRASRIVRDLAHAQGSSLQGLMWYSFDSHTLTSDVCSVVDLDDENELSGFRSLKQLSFNVHDFATGVHSGTWGQIPSGYKSLEDYYVDYVAQALPKSLECLVLWENANTGLCGNEQALERALVKMIEEGLYKNLRTIFIHQVKREMDSGRCRITFEKAVEAGNALGVDVFTCTNRLSEQSTSFPRPVDRFDLRTGRYPDGKPKRWVLNPYTACKESIY